MEERQVTGESARHGKGHQAQIKKITIDDFKTLNTLFDSITISNAIIYIVPIYIYIYIYIYILQLHSSTTANCGPSHTTKLENTVNTFQRIHLSRIWPKKIDHIELYIKTKTEEWSTLYKDDASIGSAIS